MSQYLDYILSTDTQYYDNIIFVVQYTFQAPSLLVFTGSQFEELEHSGLARQVSVLLTNHLARATESGGNEAAGTEALQEVLSLLNNLSRSNMGKAILSQPACVSKLLSLMLDQR